MRYCFEEMQESDIIEVMSIEQECYEIGWSTDVVVGCIKSNCNCVVLKQHNKIIGYAILMTVPEESHLLNICIDPFEQGKGLGRKLLEYMEKICMYNQSKTLLLELRTTNPIAYSFYKSFGFVKTGLRKNYYEDDVDAIIMRKDIV